jgi:hypothetical protein
MGTPGCPQDACHLPDPDPEHWARCGHCHEYHAGYDRAELLESIAHCADKEYGVTVMTKERKARAA